MLSAGKHFKQSVPCVLLGWQFELVLCSADAVVLNEQLLVYAQWLPSLSKTP